MLLREPNISSLKRLQTPRKQKAQPNVGVLWKDCSQSLHSCCSVALTSLILEIITSSLESSYLQTSRGNVGALLPVRTAALARSASLRPEAPGGSGTMAPCGS